ncbi:MAG: hypothetical protein KKH28_09290 [Elusimicrobia bacterium]|nr:hypothetical protein [Elusimicrobiota bacterium]
MAKHKQFQKEPDLNELTISLQAAHHQILSLENKLDEFKWLEESLRKRTKELGERVKELECLYAVGNSLPGTKDLVELFQIVCESIPKGFQFPGTTWVSLEMFGQKFSSRGFKDSEHQISCDILVRGKQVGRIIVSVVPVFDRHHKTAILPEETRLLQMIAILTGKIVENKVDS